MVQAFTDSPNDPNRQKIGFHLSVMRGDRNAADYDLNSDRLINIAACTKRNLTWAKEVFGLLDLIQEK